MNIEQLVRAEFHSVADQVVAPAMPPLEDRRRTWAVVVAAAAAAALVIGGLTWALRDRAEQRPIEVPKRVHIDGSAPTIPWMDGDKLYVDGDQLPGRWLEVVSAGGTWIARREDRHVVWGRGSSRHDLGRVGDLFGAAYAYPLRTAGPFLSRNGRYLVITRTGEAGPGEQTLLDTKTGRQTPIPLVPPGDGEEYVVGVSDRGQVLANLWVPVGGDEGEVRSRILRPGKPPVRVDTGRGHLVASNAGPGLVLEEADGHRWVVDLDGRRLSKAVDLGKETEGQPTGVLSPDRKWMLDLTWSIDQDEPGAVPVTDVAADRTGAIQAPKGWVFAPLLAPGFWEPEGTLVIFVVDPETRQYRVARCAPLGGACVLVEE